MAWVGYAEHNDAKTVRPVAWAGFDSEYVEAVKLSWSDRSERGRGPGGTAIRSGERVVMGGRIWAEGRVNQGSTFYFVFH